MSQLPVSPKSQYPWNNPSNDFTRNFIDDGDWDRETNLDEVQYHVFGDGDENPEILRLNQVLNHLRQIEESVPKFWNDAEWAQLCGFVIRFEVNHTLDSF